MAVTRACARRTASAAAAVAVGGVSSVGHSTSARGSAARALLRDRFALRGHGRCLGGGERTPPRRPTQSRLAPGTRKLRVARALRRLPTRLGVSNPAPTHSGESTRAFLADPVFVWRLLSGHPCVASPHPRGSRLAALARRARRAWSQVVPRAGGRMPFSDASMTSEWRVYDAHAFMMCACHARVMIAHVMRGMAWCAGGAARRDATRTRAVGCACVGGRIPVSDARHACDHDGRMIRTRS